MKQLVHTIEYDGKKFKYDANAFKRWDVQKAFEEARRGGYTPIAVYDALFMGHADDVAEQLDNDATKVDDLAGQISKAIADSDETSKN